MVTTRRRARSLSSASSATGVTTRRRTRSLSSAGQDGGDTEALSKSAAANVTAPDVDEEGLQKKEENLGLTEMKMGVDSDDDNNKVNSDSDREEKEKESSDHDQVKADDNEDQEEGEGNEEEDETNSSVDGDEHSNQLPCEANIDQPRTSPQKKHNDSKGKQKNALTRLIPGYTAPMRLNSSSLDKFRPAGGIRELQMRAERSDASTKDFVLEAATKHTKSMQKSSEGFLPKSYTAAYSSFKKGAKRAPDNTAGAGWFGMTPTPMTEELKTDLAIIRNRTYLDPKRFYKSADKNHKIVQLGTVIEGPSEFYSSRLTKKQRRANFTEEIMADPASADYAKNKFKEMSREKTRQSQMRKKKPQKRARKFY
mmetsp:Transcript_4907/g.9128  ORF Transcript_4907/g.9128 Transcript_4907/m.9128 type:complete len:368 (-) Transcript_4907:241-1344(-)